MKRSLLWLLVVVGAPQAQASYYAIFAGGYDMLKTSNYSSAFTANGFAAPPAGQPTLGIRLGNEGGSGSVRLAFSIVDTLNHVQQLGTAAGEFSQSRWSGMMQFNLNPGSFLAFTIGGEVGMGFNKLLILSTSANGVAYERYWFVAPMAGLELMLSPYFRLFADASYGFPFSVKQSARGDALGVTRVAASNVSVLGGLSFYFAAQ